jgi:hypothetical protein
LVHRHVVHLHNKIMPTVRVEESILVPVHVRR